MIHYVQGDATQPIGEGNKIIAHVVNSIGKWGKGFTKSIDQRWPLAATNYKTVALSIPLRCGMSISIRLAQDIFMVHMVAQLGVRSARNPVPLLYPALEECLRELAKTARDTEASVHMPRIGCGLAGGQWELVEPLIQKHLPDITVYIYDLPPRDS